MSIWITRSEPGATTLADALAAAGFAAFKAPVLEIRPLPFARPSGHFDLAIFMSANGAGLAAPRLEGCFDQAFAIGKQTAAVLAKAGVGAEAAEVETSEGLLDVLPNVDGRRILLVAGVGGRSLLAPALTRQGAQVERLEVYERWPRTPLIEPASIDAIVVSSGDGFRQAARVWFSAGGAPEVPVLAPSTRVAGLGAELGASNIIGCAGASPAAVLDALRRMEWVDE